MQRHDNKKGIVIASITMGIIGVFLLNLFKKSLEQIPIIKKIVNYKRVGVDSLKDFLELGELRLRLETFEDGIIPLYDGAKILWDTDESQEYTILISSDHISKIEMIDCENIPELDSDEKEKLNLEDGWKRKIILNKESKDDGQWDETKQEWHSKLHSENTIETSCVIPLDNFYCRVKSSNGRISNELKYPIRGKVKLEEKIINAWVTSSGNVHYLHLKENKEYKIYDYKVVLYIADGKGIVRTLPKFKGYLKFKLGILPPCLCYVRGTRTVGVIAEEFVSWINESQALQIE
jgi:hypothetical protein